MRRIPPNISVRFSRGACRPPGPPLLLFGNGRASLALRNSSEKLLASLWFEENKYYI